MDLKKGKAYSSVLNNFTSKTSTSPEELLPGDVLEEILREGARTTILTMVFKLTQEAEKTWKRLKGCNFIPLVLEERVFVDGILQKAA